MIIVLIISAVLLSFFCFLLNKQYTAVLLIVMASSHVSPPMYGVITTIFFTATLHFFLTFFTTKQKKSFLLIILLPLVFILVVFLIQPYKINYYNYLGYLATLFIFAWVMLLKWDTRKIVHFLTAYGLFLVLAGFLEKIITDNVRVGVVLTVATAYAVVLVVTWTIWTTNIFLSKMYSLKIIFLGTSLAFLAIILSGTRMGLLGFFIGIGLCCLSALFIKKRNIIRIVIYTIGIVITLLFFSVIVWNLLPEDLYVKKTFSSLLAGKIDDSNTGRIVMWVSVFDTFKDNKFLGIGAGNFYVKFRAFLMNAGLHQIAPPAVTGHAYNINSHAHNLYLMLLVEHGIIGFLTLSIFVFLCILQPFLYFLKERQNSDFFALSAGFVVMAILGFADSMALLLPTSGFAAWLLGTCASFYRRDIVREKICL
jgi:O-antigen ligase